MSLCPNGHDSTTADYCDTCGILIGMAGGAGGAGVGGAGGVASAGAPAATTPSGTVTPSVSAGDCPNCGAAKVGGERFCEVCGLDFDTGRMPAAPQAAAAPAATAAPSGPIGSPAPPAPLAPGIGWTAVLSCDRDWWQHNTGAGGVADGVPYPDPEPAPRRIELRTREAILGRTSGSSVADIDCGSADTGVSRKHAKLTLRDDDTWTVTDLGSTNGTFIGDGSTKLNPQAETPFDPLTAVKIGAYTVLRLEPTDPSPPTP